VATRRLNRGRQVEITYDLAGDVGDTVYVSVALYADSSADTPVRARTLTGDLGVVQPGPRRRIVWDAGADLGRKLPKHYRAVVQATRERRRLTALLPRGATMEMVWIPPGAFTMGSPPWQRARDPDEGPPHEVTLTRGFWLGRCEVTQGQWERVMATRPWEGQERVQDDPECPAVCLSWDDFHDLIHRLNEAAGDSRYRLPTEAEWEYACRAGTQGPWSWGDEEGRLGQCARQHAWYRDNTVVSGTAYAHPVGHKLPNPWGLHDMHGNVWEWVADRYDAYTAQPQVDPQGSDTGWRPVVRGGAFDFPARYTRSANRNFENRFSRTPNCGARLVRLR
jgi:formylglycine-generating enzyme required for sulfatase activity